MTMENKFKIGDLAFRVVIVKKSHDLSLSNIEIEELQQPVIIRSIEYTGALVEHIDGSKEFVSYEHLSMV